MCALRYEPLEPLQLRSTVDRLDWIVEHCRGRSVLDLGCYDETALGKRDTQFWLHGRIAEVASAVLGVDNSPQLPADGLRTGPNSSIVRGDILDLAAVAQRAATDIEVIVAGELVEHLPNTLSFLCELKRCFPGRELIASTPNATSLSNGLLAFARRESCHVDHLQIYSYKTLATLCRKAGIADFEVLPYHTRFTEMSLRNQGLRRAGVELAERAVNLAERVFPLLSGGLLLHVQAL